MDELVAAIGKYKSMDKDKSCLEEGEYDGFFYYDGFTVSATTKKWSVDYLISRYFHMIYLQRFVYIDLSYIFIYIDLS